MGKLIRGSRVQLNELGLKYFKSRLHKTQINAEIWINRFGTIRSLSRDKQRAKIIWDNNKYPSEAIPVKFLKYG